MTYTTTFDGDRVELKPGLSTPHQPETLGDLYVYDNGQARIEFVRGGTRDWYVWSVRRQSRLATYQTRRELRAAYLASVNHDGPFGLSRLCLSKVEIAP